MAAGVYRGMQGATLDAAYNNAAAVGGSEPWIEDWTQRSEQLVERLGVPGSGYSIRPDMAYGLKPRNRIDLVLDDDPYRPTLLFFHGGYWQLNSKSNFTFLAEGILAAGMNAAFAGYTLAPDATIGEIVAESLSALDWTFDHLADLEADPTQIAVAGWSAGGHLAAMAMADMRVRFGLAVSGIFDLEPIRLSYINNAVGMDDDDVLNHSPIRRFPDAAGHLTVAVGGNELPELQRQSEAYAAAWRSAGLEGAFLRVPERHHFQVLAELASPSGALVDVLKSWKW